MHSNRRHSLSPFQSSGAIKTHYICAFLVVIGLLMLTACERQPSAEQRRPRDPYSIEQAVLIQLREVIRYEDEQQKLKLARLQELGLEAGKDPAQHKQRHHQRH
jgi:uncharacterized lipoprotein YajG